MSNTTQQKVAEDVASRAHKMPRGSTLLFRNRSPKNEAASHYRGLLKLENGDSYWVGLWVRKIDQERVLELKVVPKS
jgi:hypothetical protein